MNLYTQLLCVPVFLQKQNLGRIILLGIHKVSSYIQNICRQTLNFLAGEWGQPCTNFPSHAS